MKVNYFVCGTAGKRKWINVWDVFSLTNLVSSFYKVY